MTELFGELEGRFFSTEHPHNSHNIGGLPLGESMNSTDRLAAWPIFGFSLASACQQYRAYTECKLFQDLDTLQEPA